MTFSQIFTFWKFGPSKFNILEIRDSHRLKNWVNNGIGYYPSPWWGGLFDPPPCGFSRIARKRRRAAPPNFAYLFPHQFCILCAKISPRWPKVRSPGQVKWPYLQKSLSLRQSYSSWAIDMKISGVSKGDSIYKTYISEFLYLWPEVRSISRPPHYKSMGEISTSSECHPMPSICSGSWYYRSLLVIQPKYITCDLWKVLPRSSEVTWGHQQFYCNNFWLKRDRASGQSPLCLSRQCGSNDMQYDQFGSGHDLDLRSNFKFDLLRSNYISFNASWWDKHGGVWTVSLSYLEHELLQKNDFHKNGYFDLAWPLEAKLLTWPQNCWHQVHLELKELSNAFFRAFLALLVSELQTDWLYKMPKFRKFWGFWPLVTSFLTWSKNWLKYFRHDFWRAFERRLARLATMPRSRVSRGGVWTPPPSRWWKI